MRLMGRRSLAVGVIILLGLAAAGEWFARAQLGLGNPPLSVAHPTIEYLFKPNQDVRRFDNRVHINVYGMRSEDFPENKPQDEFRLLVFGDSVLNGGNLTDQTELATELLRDRLEQALERPVVVGNVSAGSWGPGNWLSYAREYGFLDADAVILLISTHDHRDNPTFEPLNPHTHPQRAPVLAVWEGVTRYLPRYLPDLPVRSDRATEVGAGASQPDADDTELAAERGLADLSAFLELAQGSVPVVVVAQFLDQSELLGEPGTGHFLIRDLARQQGVAVAPTEPWFREALETGPTPFRDNIHINAVGQAALADAFWDLLWAQAALTSGNTGVVEPSSDQGTSFP